MDLRTLIIDVPDFPKPGIIFKDISPLLAKPTAYANVLDQMANSFENKGITHVLGAEARGFLFGPAVALQLQAAFVPVRKPGKLPLATLKQSYDLEYGQDQLEIHANALDAQSRVLLVDDVLATGGTIQAIRALAEQAGATVIGASFLMELSFLHGRDRLPGLNIFSTVIY